MEEVLPPQTESGSGYEPVRVRQFTVFLENRVGRLQALVRAYEEARGQIVALAIQNAADTALVRMICSDADLAVQVLKSEGFSFTQQDLICVELPKRVATPILAVTAALLAAEINIHYAYPLLIRPGGPALAMCVDDYTLAAQLLMRKQFRLIGESDLKK